MRAAGIVVLFSILVASSTLLAQSSGIPFIQQPLVPTTVAPGSGGLTLTVNGAGFASNATVYWNGSARTTVFHTSSQLTATITSTDVAAASTAIVTVANGSGSQSNFVPFPI